MGMIFVPLVETDMLCGHKQRPRQLPPRLQTSTGALSTLLALFALGFFVLTSDQR